MKHYIFVLVFISSTRLLMAQPAPYNVVFDLTSSDTTDHKALIRWIKGISASKPDAKMEVVFYGESLNMLMKDKSVVANDIKDLVSNKIVALKVCAATMKRHQVEAGELIPGVEIVPDGIYEITAKQHDGWGYIKVAH